MFYIKKNFLLYSFINIRPIRKLISLFFKKVRNWIIFKIYLNKYLQIMRGIESKYGANTVYIFQHQFFDFDGNKCFNGGAERYVCDLAEILTAMGKKAVLIQISKREIWERKFDNLTVIGVPVKNNYHYINFLSLFQSYEFVIYSGYYDWGRKIHPNVLISHGVVWDHHSEDVKTSNILKIIQDVDIFVSVDINTISWLRTTFSKTLQYQKMNFVPNYVDTFIYKPNKRKSDGKIRIVFPRRCSFERGYWLISAALPKIMEKYSNAEVDLVGFVHDNEINADIKRNVLKFNGRVNHYVLEPDEMIGVYQQADISLILTLFCEGTSLACLEAQATGNVVISTNIGGLPNLIIDGYNGFLINPNIDDLIRALDKAIANPNLCAEISANAVSVAKVFDKKIWINRWQKIIESVKSSGRLIAITIVRNESKNYLRPWLDNMKIFADYHIFLDDASDDDTPQIIQQAIDSGYPGELHCRKTSIFRTNEPALRSELWEYTRRIARDGDWILMVDADEFYDDELLDFKKQIVKTHLAFNYDICKISCRDMWSKTEYRCDGLWSPNNVVRLIRFIDVDFGATGTKLHMPPYPLAINLNNNYDTNIKMIHLAYLRDSDRKKCYNFYTKNTAPGTSMNAHALSILDAKAKLKLLYSSSSLRTNKIDPLKDIFLKS